MLNQAVILAGGFGTRMRDESDVRPKPMVLVDGIPVIDHIIRNLIKQEITNIVILLGHKGEVIKDYFVNYKTRNFTTRVNLSSGKISYLGEDIFPQNLQITLIDTGEFSLTGDRILRGLDFFEDEFLLTYGDGLSNVDIAALFDSHSKSGIPNSVTVTYNPSRFGVVKRNSEGLVTDFNEKPDGHDLINMGFFILNKKDAERIPPGTMFEHDHLKNLISDRKLNSYMHEGFFLPIDTPRDVSIANELAKKGTPPWKI
jgi:glucose-1-phosphate cytidylyltransferase